jgi:hypothetical protein
LNLQIIFNKFEEIMIRKFVVTIFELLSEGFLGIRLFNLLSNFLPNSHISHILPPSVCQHFCL